MNFKKTFLFLGIFLFLSIARNVLAEATPVLVYSQQGNISINNPENSQAFYDNLKGASRDYFIDSAKDFQLDINILVPEVVNRDGKYSVNVFDASGTKIYSLDGAAFSWQEFYDSSIRDYFMKGPELSQQMTAGKYKIEVYSANNQGEYVLVIGKKEVYNIQSVLNIYWQLPLLKLTFFKTSVLEFFLTPFGIAGIGAIGGLLILIAFIYYLTGVIKAAIKHNQAKTLLLTSGGMLQMRDEIIKLLQRPAYNVTVAFITTAAKPEENTDYMQRDFDIMKEMGFNVEEVDLDGKNEAQVMKLLELKDIVYVEGGNTFYLLKSMRACNFEKVMRKLLKVGKVYIGASAGSIVAGKTVKTGLWKDSEKNKVGLINMKGLNFIPFDIFVHYAPEHAELIKQKMPNASKRAKNLRILTDDQALLVQGKEIDLIGDGEQIVI